MTSLYTFRLIFVTFHGEAKTEAHAGHGVTYWLPLSVLIVLSTFIGAMITPPLAGVLPQSVGHAGGEAKHSLEIASGAIALAGILLAARSIDLRYPDALDLLCARLRHFVGQHRQCQHLGHRPLALA